jgi:hypothetical protein
VVRVFLEVNDTSVFAIAFDAAANEDETIALGELAQQITVEPIAEGTCGQFGAEEFPEDLPAGINGGALTITATGWAGTFSATASIDPEFGLSYFGPLLPPVDVGSTLGFAFAGNGSFPGVGAGGFAMPGPTELISPVPVSNTVTIDEGDDLVLTVDDGAGTDEIDVLELFDNGTSDNWFRCPISSTTHTITVGDEILGPAPGSWIARLHRKHVDQTSTAVVRLIGNATVFNLAVQ